jgi:hypothetical protein
MKPSNVLIRAHDSSATVMDFGIAKMTTSTRLTATGQTMGTVRYMSPEQVRGQEVDLRTDLYSLGATLYESLTGDTPFDGSTHFEIMTKHLAEVPKRPSARGLELPQQLEDALMRSLAKKPEDRFESAREMRKLLEGTLRDQDVSLSETQKVGREVLSELRAPAAAASSAKDRVATAAELADQLEPGETGPARAKLATPRRWWPWLAAGVIVLLGGGVAAVLIARRAPGYEAVTRLPRVELTAGQQFADLKVLIETDGTLTPDEVGNAYRETLAELAAFDTSGATLQVLDTIAAVPQATLCDRGVTFASQAPCIAATAVGTSALGKGGSHLLLISNARDALPATMRRAVASAICDFQPTFLDARQDKDKAKLEAACAMTRRFAERATAGK